MQRSMTSLLISFLTAVEVLAAVAVLPLHLAGGLDRVRSITSLGSGVTVRAWSLVTSKERYVGLRAGRSEKEEMFVGFEV